MLDRWFLAHPRSVDEDYLEHQAMAFGFSAALLKAAAACFIHGLLPALFPSTASRTVAQLHKQMVTKRAIKRLDIEAASSSSALGDARQR
jgi:hypothetical protein